MSDEDGMASEPVAWRRMPEAPPATPRIALILSGGGARGAYEAGVLAFLIADLPKRLGFVPSFDIVSGASVGAIHAAYWMATLQEDAATRVARLVTTWDSMSLERVYRLSLGDLLRIPSRLFSFPFTTGAAGGSAKRLPNRIPGLLDTSALEAMVLQQIPWRQLRSNLRASRGVLCVSCTEIASGRSVVFVDGARVSLQPWDYDPYVVARHARVGASHILASAAIPLFFPAVRIGRHFYCDGGLRLNTPLAPALRLGADRLLVVPLRHPPDREDDAVPSARETAYGNPAYLAGKILDAMLLDHVDYDLQRMRLMNALLLGGERAFGPEFLPRINEIIRATRGSDYRVVRDCVIRPSEDLGRMAGRCYAARSRSLRPARLVADLVMRSAVHGVPEGEADLLSYVLFDGSYTRELFALGRSDAARQVDEIAHVFLP